MGLSRALAAPWPSNQRRDGSFAERLGKSRYGDAMLGYGLLHAGIRDRNKRFVRSGLRGVSASIRRSSQGQTLGFNVWAVAASYNLARAKLRHLRGARRALKRWRRWLTRRYPTHLFGPYENKSLVDAVAVLEAHRGGFKADLTSRPVVRAAVRLVNRRVPAAASGFVLSDSERGTNPIAYHALSTALYGRAVQLLGRGASRGARATLLELVRTASQATAPDGDFAIWGRSMEQKWTLAGLAAGEAVAARLRASRRSTDLRLHALAARQLARAASYGVGPVGEWIVPVLRQDFNVGRRGIDGYARTTEYTGLSLVFANWAGAALPSRPVAGSLESDRDMANRVGQRFGSEGVVRRGNVWFAVRQYGRDNLRYDFGVQAFKRLANGVWQDVMPLRPVGFGSAGPLLVHEGKTYFATGNAMRVERDTGGIEISGGFRRNRRWLRRGVVFRVKPDSCGVSMTVNAKGGDQLRFAAFLRQAPEHKDRYGVWSTSTGADPIHPLDQLVRFNVPLSSFHLHSGYHSASEAHLLQGRFRLTAPRDGDVTMTFC